MKYILLFLFLLCASVNAQTNTAVMTGTQAQSIAGTKNFTGTLQLNGTNIVTLTGATLGTGTGNALPATSGTGTNETLGGTTTVSGTVSGNIARSGTTTGGTWTSGTGRDGTFNGATTFTGTTSFFAITPGASGTSRIIGGLFQSLTPTGSYAAFGYTTAFGGPLMYDTASPSGGLVGIYQGSGMLQSSLGDNLLGGTNGYTFTFGSGRGLTMNGALVSGTAGSITPNRASTSEFFDFFGRTNTTGTLGISTSGHSWSFQNTVTGTTAGITNNAMLSTATNQQSYPVIDCQVTPTIVGGIIQHTATSGTGSVSSNTFILSRTVDLFSAGCIHVSCTPATGIVVQATFTTITGTNFVTLATSGPGWVSTGKQVAQLRLDGTNGLTVDCGGNHFVVSGTAQALVSGTWNGRLASEYFGMAGRYVCFEPYLTTSAPSIPQFLGCWAGTIDWRASMNIFGSAVDINSITPSATNFLLGFSGTNVFTANQSGAVNSTLVLDQGRVGMGVTPTSGYILDIKTPATTHSNLRIGNTTTGYQAATVYADAGVDKFKTGVSIFGSTDYDIWDAQANSIVATFDQVSAGANLNLKKGNLVLQSGSNKGITQSNGSTLVNGTFSANATVSGTTTLGSSGSPLKAIVTGTAAIDFASTAAGTSTFQDIAVTGAAVNDAVWLGLPSTSGTITGASWSPVVISSGTVRITLTNTMTVTAVDPASGTYRVDVTEH